MSIKVLIVDDSREVAEVVSFGARMNWPACQVNIAADGREAIRSFADDPADLVILDVGMPGMDGFEVCRRIREMSQAPILMLTVRDMTIDKIRALDLGADDYLTKPFDHLELLARLRALMRRSTGLETPGQAGFVQGELSVDFASHQVRLGDEVIHLTSTEYRLLEVLVRNAGMTMTHRVLLERVWGPGWVGDPSYLKVFIRRLRNKLGDDAESPRYIETHWGTGYRFLGAS